MDYLIKALTNQERIRVYIAKTTNTLNKAIEYHDLWPSAASVLGKTMTVALIMGATLKGDEALTIKIDGNGPIGTVVADSNSKGDVRGYVEHPHVHFTNASGLDEITTLGYNGYLDVIKDLKLKDLFTSSVPLQSGDLAKDFTYYFASSEQTPSLTSLGIIMNEDNTCEVCGGILIQLLPNATEEDITFIESKSTILESMSQLLKQHENLEEILQLLFKDDYRILETKSLRFYCECSKEKFARGIASLGIDEIQSIINEDEKAEVICHYCKEQYIYTKEDLEELIGGIK